MTDVPSTTATVTGLPPVVEQVLSGLVRHGVTALGAWLTANGVAVSGSWTETLTGAIMVVVATGFSGVQKWWSDRKARKLLVASAAASAERREPVVVTVTPEGMPNIATRISATEIAAAPASPSGPAR